MEAPSGTIQHNGMGRGRGGLPEGGQGFNPVGNVLLL
jgi:hypothetical protein